VSKACKIGTVGGVFGLALVMASLAVTSEIATALPEEFAWAGRFEKHPGNPNHAGEDRRQVLGLVGQQFAQDIVEHRPANLASHGERCGKAEKGLRLRGEGER